MASSYDAPLPVDVGNPFGLAVELPPETVIEQEFSTCPGELLGDSRDGIYVRQFLASSLPLWLADQLALAASLAISSFTVAAWHTDGTIEWISWFVGLGIAGTLISWILGLYPAVGLSAESELRFTTLSGLLLFAGAAVTHTSWVGAESASSLLIVYGGLLFLFLAPLLRRHVRTLASRTSWWAQPVLVFGGGESGLRVFRALFEAPECGLRPIGIVDDLDRHWSDDKTDPSWYLGPWSDAAQLIEGRHVFRGIVPLEEGGEHDLAKRLSQLAGTLPHLVVTFGDWSALSQYTSGELSLVGIPAIRINQRLLMPLQKWAKYALDLLLVVAVGVVVLPLIAVLAALIYATSRGPVFFSHDRIGAGGRTFRMWKFRTMVENAEEVLHEHFHRDPTLRAEWRQYHKLRRDPRVTWLGRFLRVTSFDELPQIWNVLRGDMSFVGPRPYPLYEYDDMRRTAPVIMRVRPGITGLWQISGRSGSTFEMRLRIDANYVRDWSPWLDLYILSRTVRVIVTCEGAY